MSWRDRMDDMPRSLDVNDKINVNTSITKLKEYVRKNYVLSREHKRDVYGSIELRHLKSHKDIDQYIGQRFNISKLDFEVN